MKTMQGKYRMLSVAQALVLALCMGIGALQTQASDSQPIGGCNVLIYYDGSSELEDLYDSTLVGFANAPESAEFALFFTHDPVVFENALDSDNYPVMVAISIDIATLELWAEQEHSVPTLLTITPDGAENAKAEYTFHRGADDDAPPAHSGPPAMCVHHTTTAPLILAGGFWDWLFAKAELSWETIQPLVEDARAWAAGMMRQFAHALQEMEGDVQVTVSLEIGDPIGIVKLKVEITGDKEAVAEAVSLLANVVQPSSQP